MSTVQNAALGEHLQEIYDSHGRLTGEIVVDVARDPGHPLHSRFEWDDSIAGELYRQDQARELIRTVKVVDRKASGELLSVRSWHSKPDSEGQSYVPLQELIDDPLTRKIVLQAAEREWKALKARYGHLSEFLARVRRDVAEGE